MANVVAIVGSLAGCAVDEQPALGDVDQSIEIGTNDTSDPIRDAVVLVGGFCTGMLVASDIILTAGHCGWDDPALADGVWHPTAPVNIYFGPLRGAPIRTITANQVAMPPAPTGGPPWLDDMVLLRLTSSVPSTVAVPRPVYLDRPASLVWAEIHEVGYGGGRNRRTMAGSGYRDWLVPGAGFGVNTFMYTPYDHGPGIGDRDTNIEGGDSGGPILLNSDVGYVIGDLTFWAPTGMATFGPGGSGRPSLRAWLASRLPVQKPDFVVQSIGVGCTGSGGNPTVNIWVKNRGVRSAQGWVDVFDDRATPPPDGTTSTMYRMSPVIAPEGTALVSFELARPPGPRRIDVLLDTTHWVAELDETNNGFTQTVTLLDCSFN